MVLERRIKVIATCAASVTLAASGLGWFVDPRNDVYVAGVVASALAVTAFVVLLRTGAPAVFVVAVTAILTIVTARLVPEQQIRTMAAVALVVISIVGVLLVPPAWQRRYLLFGGVVIASHTLLSAQPVENLLSVGVTSTVCFLVGAVVVNIAFVETQRLHAERLDLLDMAPAFISEDDWTEAERRVRALGIDDPDELRSYLTERRDLVTDIVGTVRVVYTNPALIETFALPSGGGRFNPERVHDASLGAFVEQLVSIVTDKPYHDYEYSTTTKTGDEVVLSLRSIVNRRHPGQTRVLLVAQDTTERRDSRLELERAIRMKDEFVAGVSHELRTPLAGVVGLTASVLESNDLSPQDRELLEMVADQANEMARIIEDLLVASRAHEGQLSIMLGPVDAVAEVWSVAAGREVTVEANGTVLVTADAGRLRQIVRNLVTNASRYGEPPVEIEIGQHDDRGWIEVSDRGAAIPADLRERIFEPFQSAASGSNRPTGSVGLGLAVSRMLARRMGGELTYRHDGRSIFRVELPIYHDCETAE